MLSLFLLAVAQKPDGPELTSGRPIPPEESCYDVLGYKLFVRVDPESRSIVGRVEVNAKLLSASDVIVLDLDGRLKVSKVAMRKDEFVIDQPEDFNKPAAFEQGKGEVRIQGRGILGPVGTTFTVTVDYDGVPREAPRPPWDGGFVWSKTKSGAPWIATCNQMQGGDLWWPCKDQPDDEADHVLINATVPKGLFDASNG